MQAFFRTVLLESTEENIAQIDSNVNTSDLVQSEISSDMTKAPSPAPDVGDVFASSTSMSLLFDKEFDLLTIVRKYIDVERDRLDRISAYVKYFAPHNVYVELIIIDCSL